MNTPRFPKGLDGELRKIWSEELTNRKKQIDAFAEDVKVSPIDTLLYAHVGFRNAAWYELLCFVLNLQEMGKTITEIYTTVMQQLVQYTYDNAQNRGTNASASLLNEERRYVRAEFIKRIQNHDMGEPQKEEKS